MDNKQEAIERSKERLEAHFKEFRHDIHIPFLVDMKLSDPRDIWNLTFEPVMQSYLITYEDWYNFNKVRYYRQEFEKLVND